MFVLYIQAKKDFTMSKTSHSCHLLTMRLYAFKPDCHSRHCYSCLNFWPFSSLSIFQLSRLARNQCLFVLNEELFPMLHFSTHSQHFPNSLFWPIHLTKRHFEIWGYWFVEEAECIHLNYQCFGFSPCQAH